MGLLVAWKKSLQLLKFDRMKQFLSAVFSALPQVYKNWFKNGWLAIILLIVATLVHIIFFFNSDIAALVFIALASLLSAYAVLNLYTVVKESLQDVRQSYKKHLIYGMVFLTIYMGTVVYLFYYSWFMDFSETTIYFKEKVERALAHGKEVPAVVLSSIKTIHLDVITPLLLLLFMCIALGIGLAAYFLFFFLDERASVAGLIKSIGKALKFILFNLPFLIIIYGLLYLISYVLNYSLYAMMSTMHTDQAGIIMTYTAQYPWFLPLISFLEITFLMPIYVLIFGQLYKLYRNNY